MSVRPLLEEKELRDHRAGCHCCLKSCCILVGTVAISGIVAVHINSLWPPITLPPPPTPAQIEAKGNKWVHTMDGRIMEYSVSGSKDPNANVVINTFFAPSPRIPVPHDWIDAVMSLNIRYIQVGVAGCGLSEVHPGMRVVDWPWQDLEPVLQAENVTGKFYVTGMSEGCLFAMATAQHFGPDRVKALGLRVPFLTQPISRELGLPDAHTAFPVRTADLEQGTAAAWYWYWMCWLQFSAPNSYIPADDEGFRSKYPQLVAYLNPLMNDAYSTNYAKGAGMLYAETEDVVLDAPGLDPRMIAVPPNRTLVWWATNDGDAPSSHGKWLAEHWGGKYNRVQHFGSPTHPPSRINHLAGAILHQPEFLHDLILTGSTE